MLIRKLEISLGSDLTIQDLQEFVRAAEEGGASPSDVVLIERDENDEISRLSFNIQGRQASETS